MKNLKDFGFSNYCATSDGRIYSLLSEKFLRLQDRNYQQVGLRSDTGKVVNCYVHRLVAQAFVSGYSEGKHVNHIDGNKFNNCSSNLEWVTRSENMLHAYDTGLIENKELQPDIKILRVCRMMEQGSRAIDAHRATGVPYDTCKDIVRGKAYHSIAREFDFNKMPKKARLSDTKVINICKLLVEGKSPKFIATTLDVEIFTVYRIRARKFYQYLSNSFDW